jgi:hypothetical protein
MDTQRQTLLMELPRPLHAIRFNLKMYDAIHIDLKKNNFNPERPFVFTFPH